MTHIQQFPFLSRAHGCGARVVRQNDKRTSLIHCIPRPTFSGFRICAATALLAWASASVSVAQNQFAEAALADSIVGDQALGVSFLRVGDVKKHGENGYAMSLQSLDGRIKQATAGVSISPSRAVDLSGSYGGTVNPDDPAAASLLKNRVKVDTVTAGGLQFRREYWAVYAGMGAWEGIIHCYAFNNGQYDVLSLNAGVILGKPGDDVDGEKMTTEQLQARMVTILSDSHEPVVKMFNDLLSSFQVRH